MAASKYSSLAHLKKNVSAKCTSLFEVFKDKETKGTEIIEYFPVLGYNIRVAVLKVYAILKSILKTRSSLLPNQFVMT